MPSEEVVSGPTPALQFRGDLADTPLPELLYSIDRFQVPGVIEVVRQGVVKQIFIKSGNVVHASSTDLTDSLGSYLERSARLSPHQTAEIMAERRNSSKRLGVLLIECGLLSPVEVYAAIRTQVEEIVWSLFSWSDGAVSFRIGEFQDPAMVRIQLPVRQVILEGIRRSAHAKILVARLGRKETVFEPDFHNEALIEIALTARDLALLVLVDGKRTLYEISQAGPYSVADNAKLLYAFHVMRLIRKAAVPERPAERPDRGATGAIKIRFKPPLS
jgi:hypothetical protein